MSPGFSLAGQRDSGFESTHEQSRHAAAPQAGQVWTSATLAPNTVSISASVDSDGSTLSAWWFMSAPQRGHFIFFLIPVIGYIGTFSRPYRRVRDIQMSSFRNLSMRRM